MSNTANKVTLSTEDLTELIEASVNRGAAKALKSYVTHNERERQKKEHAILHDTNLLLKNYHRMKEHAENSVTELKDIVELNEEMTYYEKVTGYSLFESDKTLHTMLRSTAKTKKTVCRGIL